MATTLGTYVPVFPQAKGAEIAVYVVTYYVLLLGWCLGAFLIMRRKAVLQLAEKYAKFLVPFLYIGLGIYIVIASHCYPWSIQRIDAAVKPHMGRIAISVSTAGLVLVCIIVMVWWRWRAKHSSNTVAATDLAVTGADGPVTGDTPAALSVEHGVRSVGILEESWRS